MASNKKAFTMRLEPHNYEKFMTISKKNRRSMAAELELIVEHYIDNYESQHGQIPLAGDDSQKSTVTQSNSGGNNYLAVGGSQIIKSSTL